MSEHPDTRLGNGNPSGIYLGPRDVVTKEDIAKFRERLGFDNPEGITAHETLGTKLVGPSSR